MTREPDLDNASVGMYKLCFYEGHTKKVCPFLFASHTDSRKFYLRKEVKNAEQND